MILDLDDDRCLDPATSGAKGAWLARGRRVGLPVVAGFVVAADASRAHLALGREALERRGSGGARLEVAAFPLDPALLANARERADSLATRLIVRSSSILEGKGAWAGAFTSYADVGPEDLEVAIRGCWSANFSIAALRRQENAAVLPGSIDMAVVVQSYVCPEWGGVAHVEPDRIVIDAVPGSPVALVQGWEAGLRAAIGPSGTITGDKARRMVGARRLYAIDTIVRSAAVLTGATVLEWGIVADRVVIFQLQRYAVSRPEPARVLRALQMPLATSLDRLVRRAPGPLGEAFVLPWAIAHPDLLCDEAREADVDPALALQEAERLRSKLVAGVWQCSTPTALSRAARTLTALRGDRPGRALSRIASLTRPEGADARRIIALLARVRHALADAGVVDDPDLAWHVAASDAGPILASRQSTERRSRFGFDRWEPFSAAVVLGNGRTSIGQAASPGIGVGRVRFVDSPARAAGTGARSVIIATHPTPMLGALLWDAAAVVTTGGSPAAHLFESARALGIAAVCDLNLDELIDNSRRDDWVAAVDGHRGVVAFSPW